MLKWLPLILFVLSIISFIAAYRMDDKASYENGSFIVEMFLVLVGIVLFIASLISIFIAIGVG